MYSVAGNNRDGGGRRGPGEGRESVRDTESKRIDRESDMTYIERMDG